MDDPGGGLNVTCGEIQDRLPDRASGRLAEALAGEVDQHLATCGECREAFETVQWLRATKPEVPPRLESRILAAVRVAADPVVPRPAPRGGLASRLRWGWAAAAVLALAVGLPLVSTLDRGTDTEIGALVMSDEEVARVWLDDDLMVAGAPAVSELSDDALRQLLEELER
jgi:predicted anti-sigma-YlaC factor YlaD